MIGKLQCVVLDCPDAHVLAEFYRSLLGGIIDQADSRWSVDDDFSTSLAGMRVIRSACSRHVEQQGGTWN